MFRFDLFDLNLFELKSGLKTNSFLDHRNFGFACKKL